MKRNANFLLREVAGSVVVVPVGTAARSFPGMMRLNESGRYLWELLEQDQTQDSLVSAMVNRYQVGWAQATEDVAAFVTRIRSVGALDEEDHETV